MPQYEVVDFSVNEPTEEQLQRAAQAWHDDLLVLDNYTVNALAGDAYNTNLADRVLDVKGEKRREKPAMGWTRPFDERMLSMINVDAIENTRMQALLRNPDELTAAVGGLTFIRALANESLATKNHIPYSIVPRLTEEEKSEGKEAAPATVQVYSPEGVTTTEKITRMAIALGAETVMTSANLSGTPESVTKSQAIEFMESVPQGLRPVEVAVIFNSDESKPPRPRGSYPVILAESEQFVIKRPGCFEPAIIKAALDGYDVVLHETPDAVKYPDNVLRMQDLPPDVQKLRGSDFRLGMLAALGWSQTQ